MKATTQFYIPQSVKLKPCVVFVWLGCSGLKCCLYFASQKHAKIYKTFCAKDDLDLIRKIYRFHKYIFI